MVSKKISEFGKMLTNIFLVTLVIIQINNTNGEGDCDSVANGWKFQDPLDCHGFFVCIGGKSYQAYCDHSEKFDEINRVCVTGKCPPCKKCGTDCPPSPSTPPTPPTPSTPSTPSTPTPPAPTPETPKPCKDHPHGDMWRDPTDCTRFYVCSSGTIVPHKCVAGLYFNPNINACDKPNNVDCPTPIPPTPKPPVPPTPAPEIPSPKNCQDHPHGDMWRDPTDCTRFYVCSSGTIILHKCGAGLYFNPNINACDKPNNVDCPTPIPPTPKPPVPPTPTPAPEIPSPKHCQDHPHGDMWRDPTDCTRFYVCSSGTIISQKCVAGLYFNPNTYACDKPNNVDCPTPTPPTPKPPVPPTPTPAPEIPNPKHCQDRPHGDMWRDPTDCTKFYVCSWGMITQHKCTAGLHFNPNINTCDYSENVDCSKPIIPDTPTPPTPSPPTPTPPAPTPPTPTPPAPTPPAPTPPTPSTPCIGQPEGYTFKDPSNCAGYYICTNGLIVSKQCSIGNNFDPKLKTCMPKDQVICCEKCYNPCDGETGYILFRDPLNCAKFTICNKGSPSVYVCDPGQYFDTDIGACKPANTVDCKSTTTTTTTKTPQNLCGSVTGYAVFRDETNCAKYTVCNRGTYKSYECPSGRYFDLRIGACNYAYLVQCGVTPTPTPTLTPTTTTTTSAPHSPCGPFFRDQNDCAIYYTVRNGLINTFECPPGKYFDLGTSACRESFLVSCSTPTLTTTPQTLTTTSLSTTRILSTMPSTTPKPTQTTPSPAETSTVKDGQVDFSLTDCLGKPNGTRFRSRTHCRVYYTCRNTQAVKSSCPSGQWFNDKAFVCHFRELINCSAGVD